MGAQSSLGADYETREAKQIMDLPKEMKDSDVPTDQDTRESTANCRRTMAGMRKPEEGKALEQRTNQSVNKSWRKK